jgi:photosystem II stability/assembly factor-like uncharacterized protein
MSRLDKWKIIGPGAGGSHYRPAISPFDENVVLFSCDMTGSYITYDGGMNWREFNLRSVCNAFAFDFCKEGVIYAASNGIYRSEDNGRKWRLIFPKPETVLEEKKTGDHSGSSFVTSDNCKFTRYGSVSVDITESSKIYFAAVENWDSDIIYIYYSDDYGEKFRELAVLEGASCHNIYSAGDVRVVVTDKNIYYISKSGEIKSGVLPEGVTEIELCEGVKAIQDAATGQLPGGSVITYALTNGSFINGVYQSGIWAVKDGEWQPLMPFPDDISDFDDKSIPRYVEAAASPLDASNVYIGFGGYPLIDGDSAEGSYVLHHGVIRSADMGKTFEWKLKATDCENAPNHELGWIERNYHIRYDGIGPKGSTPLGLGVAPNNPGVCHFTDLGSSSRTVDGGNTWSQVYENILPDGSYTTRGCDVTTCYGVHFDPHDKDHIVISYTDIGLMHSKNGRQGWLHSMKNIPAYYGNTCYWLVFDPEVKDKSWSVWGYWHDLPRPKMYGEDYYRFYGAVCKSVDGMETWREIKDSIPENTVFTHIILDEKSPAGNRILYAAGYGKGVYKSIDDGETWELKINGIKGRGNLNVYKLLLLPDGRLYAIVAKGQRRRKEVDGALYVSSDGAENWQKIDLPENVNAPNHIEYDPSDPKRLYLSCWPKTIQGREYCGGVYKSDDGIKWEQIYKEDAHVFGLAVDPEDGNNLYICGFDHSAHRSSDRGRTWKKLRGYNFHWGHQPVLDPYNKNMLYITTYGSSVWYGPRNGDPDAFEDVYPIPGEWSGEVF